MSIHLETQGEVPNRTIQQGRVHSQTLPKQPEEVCVMRGVVTHEGLHVLGIDRAVERVIHEPCELFNFGEFF